jgi:hypothetical protein
MDAFFFIVSSGTMSESLFYLSGVPTAEPKGRWDENTRVNGHRIHPPYPIGF